MLHLKKIENLAFIGLGCCILYILNFNINNYDIKFSYDADAHIEYIKYVSQYLPRSLKIPLREHTYLFYNPPLSYLFPSLVNASCRFFSLIHNNVSTCEIFYGKFVQIFNSIIYISTILINLRVLKKINKSDSFINYGYLILISILAVNYRTVSMIRSEIYLLFFMSLLLSLVLKAFELEFKVNFRDKIYLGILVGLLALTRQTAFLLFPSFFIMYLYTKPNQKLNFIKFMSFGGLVGFLISSWFYFRLYFTYGSFTTFNQVPKDFQIMNLPLNFYIPTFDQFTTLFNTPIRPYLDNQFLTILYSDIWGDYWKYFRDFQYTDNHFDIGNAYSLISTFIILYLYTYKSDHNKYLPYFKYIKFTVLVSFIGFLYFQISFPTTSGDGVKATYFIHMIHLVIFISSINLESIKKSLRRRYNLLIMLISFGFIVNFKNFLSLM